MIALQAGAKITTQFGLHAAQNTLHEGLSEQAYEHLKSFTTKPSLVDPVARLIREGPVRVPRPRPHRFIRCVVWRDFLGQIGP